MIRHQEECLTTVECLDANVVAVHKHVLVKQIFILSSKMLKIDPLFLRLPGDQFVSTLRFLGVILHSFPTAQLGSSKSDARQVLLESF